MHDNKSAIKTSITSTLKGLTPQNIYRKLTGDIILCKFDEAPAFVKDNPYIINGYRPLLTMKQCFRSAFVWTNETLNIWTHFIGFLACFILLIFHWIVITKATVLDNVIITVGLFCYQVCQILSSCYHMFKTHSFKYYEIFLHLDYFGILFAFFGCILPLFHAGFLCFDMWYVFYMSIAFSFFFTMVAWFGYVTGIYKSLCFLCHPKSHKDAVNDKPDTKVKGVNTNAHSKELEAECAFCPIITYTGLMLATLIPAFHWVYLNGGFFEAAPMLFFPKLLILYIMMFVAFTIYITHFPECLKPGWFDFIGASHQIWHILISLVFIWCYYIATEFILFTNDHACFKMNDSLSQ